MDSIIVNNLTTATTTLGISASNGSSIIVGIGLIILLALLIWMLVDVIKYG
jgi:hypothetical protein